VLSPFSARASGSTSALHYTAVHYTALHYTAVHYIALHYTTVHYTKLHYSTLHYATLHYTTLPGTTLHFTTLHYFSYDAKLSCSWLQSFGGIYLFHLQCEDECWLPCTRSIGATTKRTTFDIFIAVKISDLREKLLQLRKATSSGDGNVCWSGWGTARQHAANGP
jgi:hypothetical protein